MTTTPPEHPEGTPDPRPTPPPPPYGDQQPPVGAPAPDAGAVPPPAGGPGYSAPPAPGQGGTGYSAPPPGYAQQGQQGQGQYGAPPAPAYGAPATGAPLSDSDQRMWAMLSHLSAIFFAIIAPLVIWLVFKGRGRFLEEQAKEALNFQITWVVVIFLASIVTFWGGGFAGFLVYIGMVVFGIIAGLAANRGEAYRYPLTMRLVS